MHQGVIRDMEQQKIKQQRQQDFDLQRALEVELRKDQQVSHDTTDPSKVGLSGHGEKVD